MKLLFLQIRFVFKVAVAIALLGSGAWGGWQLNEASDKAIAAYDNSPIKPVVEFMQWRP